MLCFNKRVSLAKTFWLKKFSKKYYLVNTHYYNVFFEPYEISKKQFLFLGKLDGSKTIEELIKHKSDKSKKEIIKFLNLLDKENGVEYDKQKVIEVPENNIGIYDIHYEFESKCNFSCQHCYQDKYINIGKSLKFEEIKKLAKALSKIGIIKIALSGGEPFLTKNLKDICCLFHNYGVKVDCIFTNGSLINNKDAKWLRQESIQVFISLDGLAKGNGLLRNLGESNGVLIFNKIIENIRKLVEGGVIVKINTVIHRHNLNELEEMYELLKKLGIRVWRMTVAKEVGRYVNNKNSFSVSEDEFAEVVEKLLKQFIRDVEQVKDGIIVPLDLRIANIFKTEMLVKPLISYSMNDSSCDYQKQRMTIKPNGDVVPCGLLIDEVFGNIEKGNIKGIFQNKKLKLIKNIFIKNIEGCNNCKFAYVCGGGCRVNSLATYGDLFHRDDNACASMNILFHNVRRILLENGYKFKFSKGIKSNNKRVYIKNTDFYF